MKKIFLSSTGFFCFILAFHISAQTVVKIGETKFTLKAQNAVNTILTSTNNVNGFLRNFKTNNPTLTQIKVTDNIIESVLKKSFFLFSYSAKVRARLTIETENSNCLRTSTTGFTMHFDLSESDQSVFDNVSNFTMNYCVTESNTDTATVEITGLLTKGDNPSETFGGMVIDEVGKQFPDFVQAFKTHLKKTK